MAGERILIVEDDATIATALRRALTDAGYEAEHSGTGRAALDHLARQRYELVVLDLGLPDIDGIDVCRHIRAIDPLLPVLMLTARQDEIDVVVGLDAGAVDYVTKPFRLAELLARMRVQLRRHETVGAEAVEAVEAPDVRIGELRVDAAARRAWVDGHELALRAKEFDLLLRLVRDAGSVVKREDLMSDVWDEHWFGSTKTLDVHIASLRRKLDRDGGDGPITTVRGIGYRFEVA
jgi:DNA-binding response OmpR family regulator